jgi:hypothetical protein
MSAAIATLDQLLRARARKQIDKDITKAIERGLDYNMANDGVYRKIDISSANLKIQDRGAEHDEDERYVVVISHKDLLDFLIKDALAYHGPIAEQREIHEFLDRVDGVAQDIEDLRNGVEQE